jgi:hypothetical protein
MHLLFLLMLLPFGAIHFLPTIVALLRGARNVLGIFLLNLLLSWTVIGWVVALVWAFAAETRWDRWGYGYPAYRGSAWR